MTYPEQAQLQIPLNVEDRLNDQITHHIAGIVTALSTEVDYTTGNSSEPEHAVNQDPLTNCLQELLTQNVIKTCKLHFDLVKLWTDRTAEGIERRDSVRGYISSQAINSAAQDTFSAEKCSQSEDVHKRAEVYLGVLSLLDS